MQLVNRGLRSQTGQVELQYPVARPQARGRVVYKQTNALQPKLGLLIQVAQQAGVLRQPVAAAARSASPQGPQSAAAAAAALQWRTTTTTSRTLMSWNWRMPRKMRRAALRAVL